jgi:CheY-like chemotaxis protein
MAKLVVTKKSLEGLAYELDTHWVTIGRALTNNFPVPDPSISGQHCEVRARGEELLVRDMRSTNGTFINGALVAQGVVRLGESFRLGEVEVRFVASEPTAKPVRTVPSPVLPHSNLDSAAHAPGTEPGKKHQVLLVDDSMAFLETMGETLEAISGSTWEIHRAASADTALFILQQHPIELAVLDVNMPMLDGVQLLRVIHRRHPDVKKVVLTGLASDTNRNSSLANGAELFLEKPVTPGGITSVFNLLNDLFVWSQREGFSGTLRQVGLTDVIQIECLRRSSCIVDIHNPDTHGSIFIESGNIVHAATGPVAGESALYTLLGLRNGEFRIKSFSAPPHRSISGPWEFLLMEAARMTDEGNHKPRTENDTVMLTAEEAEAAAIAARPISEHSSSPKGKPANENGNQFSVIYPDQWGNLNGAKT